MNNKSKSLITLLGGVVLGILAFATWQAVRQHFAGADGPKIKFYQDSMHPWVKADFVKTSS